MFAPNCYATVTVTIFPEDNGRGFGTFSFNCGSTSGVISFRITKATVHLSPLTRGYVEVLEEDLVDFVNTASETTYPITPEWKEELTHGINTNGSFE